jgi:membrane-bound acyltransferase YfiQ involved in biofilm formation
MEIFFRKYVEEFLIGFAIVLIGVILTCFVWGMIYISESLNSVFESKPTVAQTVNFNLSGAQNLNLRGLVPH